EEPRDARVVAHVPHRVHVDQEADPGDDEDHDRRDGIQPEGDVGVEAADGDPSVDDVVEHGRRVAVAGLHTVEAQDRDDRDDKCGADGTRADDRRRARRTLSEGGVPEEPDRRKEDHPAQPWLDGHHRSVETSSALTVPRRRKSCRMIARPTAASAAATASTKNTITWPSMLCRLR